MKIHNNTSLPLNTLGEISVWQTKEPLIKVVRNEWSQREVRLYADPRDKTSIVSIGVTFDQTMCVVALDSRELWARELDQAGLHITTK